MSSESRRPVLPGTRLRVMALRLFGSQTTQRFLDPVIADLQHEVRSVSDASRAGRWAVIARGYIAFWHAAACVLVWGKQRVGQTAVGIAGILAAAIVSITVPLMVLPLLDMGPVVWKRIGVDRSIELVALLLPQALAVAIPVAVLFAGFLAHRRRTLQPRAATAISVSTVSLLAALASLVIILSAVPGANQAFRERLAYSLGASVPPKKGPAEMTADELLRAAEGDSRRQATYGFYRHQKFAIPYACVALGVVTVAFGYPRPVRHPILMSAFLTALVTAVYYGLFISGRVLTLHHTVPDWAGAWGANLIFTAAALCLAWRRLSRHPRTAGPEEILQP